MTKLSATQQAAVNAYGKFLDAGMAYGEALRKAAAELGGTPCPTLLEALAAVHAKKYGCNFTSRMTARHSTIAKSQLVRRATRRPPSLGNATSWCTSAQRNPPSLPSPSACRQTCARSPKPTSPTSTARPMQFGFLTLSLPSELFPASAPARAGRCSLPCPS